MTREQQNKVFNSGDYKSLSDAQRRIFRHVVEELESRDLFRSTDCSIIASYSRNVVLAREASKEIEKRGILIDEDDNYRGTKVKKNPAVEILTVAQKAMEETAIRLGLTPTGRKRLKDEEKIKTASEAWDEQGD